MTVKREAELETEVRLLREQVASLERILSTRPDAPAACPWPHYYYPVVTGGGSTWTTPGTITLT